MTQPPREKLPRKEELLPKQEPKPQVATPLGKTTDSIAVQKAKEEADIAANQDRKVEAEIRTKLRQQGYQSIEDGAKDIELKKQEANKLLENAKQTYDNVTKSLEEAEAEKQRIVKAIEILKQREMTINSRLEKAITTENTFKIKDAKYYALQQELESLIDYHQTNIRPCVKALRSVASALYTWMDELSQSNYDFTQLYNYVCKRTIILDKYIDRMPLNIPDNLIAQDDQEDTSLPDTD